MSFLRTLLRTLEIGMSDLKNQRTIIVKGFLFLLLALLAGGLLLVHAPAWRVAALLAITVWAACRWYYFAFYVIEHYVDGTFRFSGLIDFAHFFLRRESIEVLKDPTESTRRNNCAQS